MALYQITADVEEDLKVIARYTVAEWRVAQSKRYRALLGACFKEIGQNKARKRMFEKRRPDLLFHRCEHHYIFYILRKNECPLIIALFHENMDLMKQVKKRL